MITNLPEATLAKLGRRYNPGRLMEQADVTLELAAGDGPALAALLPDGYLAEMRACYDQLHEALGAQTLAKEDSRQATKDQNAMIARADLAAQGDPPRGVCEKPGHERAHGAWAGSTACRRSSSPSIS